MDEFTPRLESLRINGFRGFRDLTIDHLGRVNLFVGKNNSGKTSIIEAVQLYFSGVDRAQLVQLLLNRDEFKLGSKTSETALAVESLFYGRPDLEREAPQFAIGPIDTHRSNILLVKFEWLEERVDTSDGLTRYVPTHTTPDLFDDLLDGRIVPGIAAAFRNRDIVIPLSRFDGRMLRAPRISRDERSPVVYLSSTGMASEDVNTAWDAITLTPDEQEVIKFLKIIIPSLDKLAVVQSPRESRSRILLAKLEQFDKPVPVKSLGEGVNHLLGIILGLLRARGGVLIVDEIENGIHYSIQSELWKIIFFAAYTWDIQVFATTHSWDCVKGFSSQADVDGMLYRIEVDNDEVNAIEFSSAEVDIAIERQIEVR
ncbi:AAA family ATPase [Brucellaceae bacterium D45D]